MVSSINVTKKEDYVESPIGSEAPSPFESPKHVVVVMDGLKTFSMEPLEWVLKNVDIESYYIITLLGVKPYLNIPLSSKTRTDIWTSDIEELSILKERSDLKYQKIHTIKEICHHYGVKLQMKSEMGFPMQRLVAEQIVGLHATLVVFDRWREVMTLFACGSNPNIDFIALLSLGSKHSSAYSFPNFRHHKKNREYYTEKIPCNMVMMNDEGEVDMIKGTSLGIVDSSAAENTPPQTPASSAPSRFAEKLKKIFKQ